MIFPEINMYKPTVFGIPPHFPSWKAPRKRTSRRRVSNTPPPKPCHKEILGPKNLGLSLLGCCQAPQQKKLGSLYENHVSKVGGQRILWRCELQKWCGLVVYLRKNPGSWSSKPLSERTSELNRPKCHKMSRVNEGDFHHQWWISGSLFMFFLALPWSCWCTGPCHKTGHHGHPVWIYRRSWWIHHILSHWYPIPWRIRMYAMIMVCHLPSTKSPVLCPYQSTIHTDPMGTYIYIYYIILYYIILYYIILYYIILYYILYIIYYILYIIYYILYIIYYILYIIYYILYIIYYILYIILYILYILYVGCSKLWYPKIALTPPFREPFASFRPSRIGTWNIIMFSCAYFVLKIYSRIVFKLHL